MFRAQASTSLGEVAGAQAAKPPSTCGCGASSESTHGNWQGVYGADGNAIAQETAAQPTYGSATFAGGTPFTWAASTTDARALLVPGSTTARIASANVSFTSQTVHVATTDGNAHTVALYFLDWDSLGRTQTVTAQTPDGLVLDAARPVAGFEGGMYAVYTVCGAVDFVINSTHGGDPIHPRDGVVSGVFFGPAMAAGAQSVTSYLVDASGGLSQVVAETDGGGNLMAYYVRVGDELLEVTRPGGSGGMWTSRFVHADGLRSVRTITDEGASVVDARGYEAFGTKNTEAGNESLAYGFAGEPLDRATKLAYHRARWMDTRAGRFAGMDRIYGCPNNRCGGYVYVRDDPADRLDPSGKLDAEGHLNLDVSGNAVKVGNKNVYVQLRSRPVEDAFFFEHLYIEYVEAESTTNRISLRKVVEAGPDYAEGTGRIYGYLRGFERNWGEKMPHGADPQAPNRPTIGANESEDDTRIGTNGVDASTHACLQKWVGVYNGRHIRYDETDGYKTDGGHNSNWWAQNVLFACGVKPTSAPPIAAFTFDLPFVDDTATGE